MNHLGTQKIQTERLILRKFQLQDAKYVFENWAGIATLQNICLGFLMQI